MCGRRPTSTPPSLRVRRLLPSQLLPLLATACCRLCRAKRAVRAGRRMAPRGGNRGPRRPTSQHACLPSPPASLPACVCSLRAGRLACAGRGGAGGCGRDAGLLAGVCGQVPAAAALRAVRPAARRRPLLHTHTRRSTPPPRPLLASSVPASCPSLLRHPPPTTPRLLTTPLLPPTPHCPSPPLPLSPQRHVGCLQRPAAPAGLHRPAAAVAGGVPRHAPPRTRPGRRHLQHPHRRCRARRQRAGRHAHLLGHGGRG